jgi:mannose-6-phosphate isomerase-like protein (cupin superfamily)
MPPAWTVKNLEDVESMAPPEFPIEARMARKHLDSTELGVSLFRYQPNAKAPYGHKHGSQEEAYIVVSGSGRMKLDDEIIDLKQWDVVRVSPAVIRGIEGGPEGIELICVGGTRPPEGDGEMVEGFWP